ncbi:MAG: CZB domain-containing protein [Candidatus Eisenbacteria bacterium]
MATKDDELLQALNELLRHHSLEIGRAIVAHRQWKERLVEAVRTGHWEGSAAEAERDDRCELGVWLQHASPETRVEPSWKHVRDMHDSFHREAAEIVTLIHQGSLHEARMALEPDAPFEVASRLLVEMLEAWRQNA